MFYICTRNQFGNENENKIQIQYNEDDAHQFYDDAMLYAFICEF